MMNASALSLLLQSCACIISLALLLGALWSSVRLDAFRQKMFALRDELFDFAADGNIGFDEPAYRLLRQSMNGTIRYAHQLTFFRVCVTAIENKLMARVRPRNWSDDWQRALERIPNLGVKQRLESFHNRSTQLVVDRLVAGSPVLLGLVLCAVPVFFLRMGWMSLKVIASNAALSTVSRIVSTRMIENEAAAAAIA
jgi:hypothetical protein